jgi:hypothetical protein
MPDGTLDEALDDELDVLSDEDAESEPNPAPEPLFDCADAPVAPHVAPNVTQRRAPMMMTPVPIRPRRIPHAPPDPSTGIADFAGSHM